ncbi:Alanyl-tRNA editing protein AlaX-L [Linum grandiflorum]
MEPYSSVPTKLDYYDDMQRLDSNAKLLSFYKGEDGRETLILDATIFHPQGGGQPADTGFIASTAFKFTVQDVRSKDGIVYHYGVMDEVEDSHKGIVQGSEVRLHVDETRRKLNSRLHSAGHLLDACLPNVGLGHLKPGKAYHFPDGPWVEYKGTVATNELQAKQKEIEVEANALISKGGRVIAAVLPYEEACEWCGGSLPEYIPKVGSNPRVVKLGDSPGCPCGGTHVSDISEIASLKVSQIRSKKGVTKVSYTVDA